jgi:mono/diheme cytochrome c family protein
MATGLHRPRAIAVLGSEVYVADYIGGIVHDIHSDGSDTTTSLVPASAPYRPALTAMTANLTSALAPAFGALFVSHVLENNTGNSTLEPVADDYGTVTSTNPKINPSVTTLGGSTPVLYAEYDGGNRVYSGPVAMAPFGSQYLLVAHVSTANVAIIDTTATTPDTRSVGTFQVGFGPMGVAVDETRDVAFVDNALDGSVSRLDLHQVFSTPAPLFAASATLVRKLTSPYSTAAQAGRHLFFDATNPHVTPSGVVACASCHPGGSDDGLVWFEHTPDIPLKRRRTPHLANAKTPTSPFHWNGQFTAMSDLVENTMTNVMAGDGLLVDVDTIQPFIDEIVKAPVLPVTDAASVARGKTFFESATVGCSGCHSGTYLTDDLLHAVLNPMSLHSDDVFPQANTPGLHGIFLAAPYFHDGRAATLHDVLTQPYAAGMGHTKGLTPADLDDLIAYVSSL